MKEADRNTPKTELERSALEMIKASRRLIALKKADPLWAGTYKVIRHRLTQLEKQLRKRKCHPPHKLYAIAKEVAELIGRLSKSLIRYKLSFHKKCGFYAFP